MGHMGPISPMAPIPLRRFKEEPGHGCPVVAAVYVLTVQVGGGERVALLVVAVALTAPALSAGSTLMTIDAPYACCWAWALVAGHRAVFRRSSWAWAAAGVLVGLGILFKY